MLRLLLFLLGWHGLPAQDALSVLSWNIRDFGASADAEEIACIAEVLRDYDAALIQEVVAGPGGPQAVARLADALDRRGADWDYAVSPPTRSPGYRTERYAVLWKTHRLQRAGRPALLRSLAPLLDREPFLVPLRWGDRRLALLNYHARAPARRPEYEIRHLVDVLERIAEHPVLLAGDFNLSERHPVFVDLGRAGYRPVLRDQPTSLVRRGDSLRLHRPYDNAFYHPEQLRLVEAGVLNTTSTCGSAALAYDVSDHAPVWMRIDLKARRGRPKREVPP